jgi:peptidoglycan hydrolase-like protein with peptidoglycan-binding domain
MGLIARGEGTYNSYNRGTAKNAKGDYIILPAPTPVDFAEMTLAEIQERQLLKKTDGNRMFAVGRYQVTPDTLSDGIRDLRLSGDERFTPLLQDKFFNDFLISIKRAQIRGYITGRDGVSLRDAQKATCLEWASVEDPDRPGHVYFKYEEKGNRMHTTAASVAVVLDEMRAHYQERIREGMTPADAWTSTRQMGPGEYSHALRSITHASASAAFRLGSHGDAVAAYQRHLHSLGYLGADGRQLSVDGHFGSDTRTATVAFQRDHGLDPDGIAGRRTMTAVTDAVSATSIGMHDAPYLRQASSLSYSPFAAVRDDPVEPASPYQAFAQRPVPAMPLADPPLGIESIDRPPIAPKVTAQVDASCIRKLQEDLTALGITNHHGNPLAATGQYDDETRMAVMGFQMDLGLPVSGEPDVATVALADARASVARMQSLRDIPMIAAPQMPGELGQELSKESMVVPREPVQATTAMPFSDPSHPQHALYADLKEQLPEQISEMRLAQFTAACHKGGIGPGEIEAIQIIDDRAVFVGAMVGFAEVDMNKRPTIEQSVEQAQVFDQQQAMEMNQRAQEMQQSQGMSMSM